MPADQPKTMTRKDWWAISVSFAALIISFTTAYFKIIRQTDDISVIIDQYPTVRVAPGTTRLIASGNVAVLFINAELGPPV